MTARVLDSQGAILGVGDRVYVGSDQPDAVVVAITDADIDADAEGRPRGIDPSVGVRYDGDPNDGVHEWWPSASTARGPDDFDAPYRCDDVRIACLCDSTEPDSFGQRDQIVNPACPLCAEGEPR